MCTQAKEYALAVRGRCFAPQIKSELQKYYDVGILDDVRIIRDKKTGAQTLQRESVVLADERLGASRQFGFLRFPSIDDAKAFVEQNHPTIDFLIRSSEEKGESKVPVRVAFSKSREDRDRERDRFGSDAEWKCSNVCKMIVTQGHC